MIVTQLFGYPVGWGGRIHQLLLCRTVRPPPMCVLGMALNNLMLSFQYPFTAIASKSTLARIDST